MITIFFYLLQKAEEEENEDEQESGDEDVKDDLIEGLEDAISRISSTTKDTGKYQEGVNDTEQLMNINFAEELNFRYIILFR